MASVECKVVRHEYQMVAIDQDIHCHALYCFADNSVLMKICGWWGGGGYSVLLTFYYTGIVALLKLDRRLCWVPVVVKHDLV